MSHIVEIKTEVRDVSAIAAACRRLQLALPTPGTANLYGGEAAGLIVQFAGWRYPAVIDTTTGEIRYDNYNGTWGDQSELDRFLQAYAVERTRLDARKKGMSVTETQLQDGSIRLQIAES